MKSTGDGRSANKKKNRDLNTVIYFAIGVMALLLSGLGSASFIYLQYGQDADNLLAENNRNYLQLPFDMLDATRYCQSEAGRRFGDSLVQIYIDQHSTYRDNTTGIYKIFMIAHVGSVAEYEEAAVHCFVDPEHQMLTHYQAMSFKKKPLMERMHRRPGG